LPVHLTIIVTLLFIFFIVSAKKTVTLLRMSVFGGI